MRRHSLSFRGSTVNVVVKQNQLPTGGNPGDWELARRYIRAIPCYFPVNSLSNYESPVFMRLSRANFSRGKKFPVLFPEEGILNCVWLNVELRKSRR